MHQRPPPLKGEPGFEHVCLTQRPRERASRLLVSQGTFRPSEGCSSFSLVDSTPRFFRGKNNSNRQILKQTGTHHGADCKRHWRSHELGSEAHRTGVGVGGGPSRAPVNRGPSGGTRLRCTKCPPGKDAASRRAYLVLVSGRFYSRPQHLQEQEPRELFLETGVLGVPASAKAGKTREKIKPTNTYKYSHLV